MKIAIVGGGWVGCHIGTYLKKSHDITLFEKTGIFTGSSIINQNRLHAGFHYSRNSKTRELCYRTFNRFLSQYNFLVEDVPKNYYAIPLKKSLVDFTTYKNIFRYENIPFQESKTDYLESIEGLLNVGEKYINPFKAKQYFEAELGDYLVNKEVSKETLLSLSKEYDIVIDSTNSHIDLPVDHYYELSLVLIYSRVAPRRFDALTLVDGPLFSIYPYEGETFTVTDVEYTPLIQNTSLNSVLEYKSTLDERKVQNIKQCIEEKIIKYYPSFVNDFTYTEYLTAIKVKKVSDSADRSPTLSKVGNIITCNTGKIQGIYEIQEFIDNEITNWQYRDSR